MWSMYSNKLCSALHKDTKEESIKVESRGSTQISDNTVDALWNVALKLEEGNHIITLLKSIHKWTNLKSQKKMSKSREMA